MDKSRGLENGQWLGVLPSAHRAGVLDQQMRQQLADSLRYILAQASGMLAVDSCAAEKFLTGLVQFSVPPITFSYYCDIVLAIEEDDLQSASRWFNELIQQPFCSESAVVKALGDPATDEVAQRFVRFIDTDPSVRFDVFAPSSEDETAARENISGAFQLMDAADPEQAAEIRALLREIVLAAGDKSPKVMTFDGVSSFMLWGGIIINAGRPSNALTMAQMLVHESTHNLLFGLSSEEGLVENADDELFSSPLRLDPRPMDGIFHAVFVLARMHRAVHALIASGKLSYEQLTTAQKDLADNARLFWNGFSVVKAHGKLTPLGTALMRSAEDHMTRHA